MTQRFFFTIAFFIVFYGLTLSAHAQSSQKLQSQIFSRYLTSQNDYIQSIEDKAKQLFQINHPQCRAQIILKRKNPIKLTHINFKIPDTHIDKDKPFDIKKFIKENAHPQKGQWVEGFYAQSCGKQMQVNMIVNALSPQTLPTILTSLNGDTKIPVIHQEKAIKSIHATFDQQKSICSHYGTIKNTQFMGYKGADKPISQKDKNLGWYELWTIKACNKDIKAQMIITPTDIDQYSYQTRLSH